MTSTSARVLTVLCCWLGAAPVLAAPLIEAVGTIAMNVGDADRSAQFFREVLSFEAVSDVEVSDPAYAQLQGATGARLRVVGLRLGSESIALIEYGGEPGRPSPSDSRSNDRWFQHVAIVVSDMDRAYQRLRQYGVEKISPEPQRLPDWNENAGGIRAFYFKSPDGDVLELLQYPAGKGDPKWQSASQAIFLGIDHTAIVVADSERSVAFYRDRLGLTVTGQGENYGVEQERLNDVSGAHLRLTTLRGPSGPGIELLEYLNPRDGRPYPSDAEANDRVHWQTELVATDLRESESWWRDGDVVSSGFVTLPNQRLGFARGITMRDPDGHRIQVVGR